LAPEGRAAVSIPNLKYLVVEARQRYAHLAGPQRAYRIVNAVCWEASKRENLRAGLFYKPRGTNYAERSLDVVMILPGGETFDVLGDAENEARPQWAPTEPTGHGDVDRWRKPVDPASLEPPPPVVPPVVHPPTVPTEPDPEPDVPVVTPPVVPATENAAILGNILSALDDVSKRVAALEAHTETHKAIDARLDSLEAAPYVVQGHIKVFGLSIPVNLPVTKV
jgi:hypothetical protein